MIPDWTRDMVRTVALPLACLWVASVALAGQAKAQDLRVNNECTAPLDLTVPVVIAQDGSIVVYTQDGVPPCDPIVGPPECGVPDGYFVDRTVLLERNNVNSYVCDSFASCFGAWPGAGEVNAYRIRLNRTSIVSLPVTVEATGTARLVVEDTPDNADAKTFTLSTCQGGAYSAPKPECSRTYGRPGGVFSFGAEAGQALCVVEPGDYWLTIIQADEAGVPGCGDDQLCTVFFGLTGFD